VVDDIEPLWKWGEENWELWSDSKHKWYTKKSLTKWVKDPQKDILLVAKIDTKPIGMCMTYVLRDWAYCTGLFVDKEYRSIGIGKTLLTETMKRLRKRRIDLFSFMVDARNAKSLRYYKKLGFARGFDSICMYKTLRKSS